MGLLAMNTIDMSQGLFFKVHCDVQVNCSIVRFILAAAVWSKIAASSLHRWGMEMYIRGA